MLTVHVSGKLVKADYEHFVLEFERLVRQHGKLRLLFDMAGFHGREDGAAWEDFTFGVAHKAEQLLHLNLKQPENAKDNEIDGNDVIQ